MNVGLVPGVYRIRIDSDDLFLVSELPERLPRGKGGKKRHRSVGFRFVKDGRRAADGEVVRLPAVKIGGLLYTSGQALQWWIDRLSGVHGPRPPAEVPPGRSRSHERAERGLDALGA